MHSIECKLIEVKEAKALQQIIHSFLFAQKRTINPQNSGFRPTLVRAGSSQRRAPYNLLVSSTYSFQKGACIPLFPFES